MAWDAQVTAVPSVRQSLPHAAWWCNAPVHLRASNPPAVTEIAECPGDAAPYCPERPAMLQQICNALQDSAAAGSAAGSGVADTPAEQRTAAAAAAFAAPVAVAAAAPAPPAEAPAPPQQAAIERPERFRPLTQQGISDVRSSVALHDCVPAFSLHAPLCFNAALCLSAPNLRQPAAAMSPCSLRVETSKFTAINTLQHPRVDTRKPAHPTGRGHQVQHGGPPHAQVAGQAPRRRGARLAGVHRRGTRARVPRRRRGAPAAHASLDGVCGGCRWGICCSWALGLTHQGQTDRSAAQLVVRSHAACQCLLGMAALHVHQNGPGFAPM
jgi:hypothetical protein